MIPLLLAACTPPEVEYCQALGTSPHDMTACTQHYFQQEAAFQHDLRFCAAEADVTYPQSLYSEPYSYPARFYGGYGTGVGFGMARGPAGIGFGGMPRTEMVHVGADYQHNARVDALRMNIIQPCMQARGWNSGTTWQAGRVSGPAKPLPWGRK